jgi:hypothetical protein
MKFRRNLEPCLDVRRRVAECRDCIHESKKYFSMKALSFYVSELGCQAKTGDNAQMGEKASELTAETGKASSIQHLTPFSIEIIGPP